MRALTLRQPWAWMVVSGMKSAGGIIERKGIENRRWSTDHRGEFLIHAAAGMTRQEYAQAVEWIADVLGLGIADRALAFPPPDKIRRGSIIGRANLVDVIQPCQTCLAVASGIAQIPAFEDHRAHDHRKWHMPEQFGFVLEDVVEFAKPIPAMGMLGFWEAQVDRDGVQVGDVEVSGRDTFEGPLFNPRRK